VRQHLPDNRVLIALWGSTGDSETLRERFGASGPDAVATTLAQAIRQARSYDDVASEAVRASRPMERIADGAMSSGL
jgi:hypothetical protein